MFTRCLFCHRTFPENGQLARGDAERVRAARESLGLALAELRED